MDKIGLNPFERRMDIMYFLSDVRETHYSELTKRYGVTAPVIKKDLDYLESVCHVPIDRIRGNNGGVRIFGDWKAYQKHLTVEQDTALKYAIESVPDTYKSALKSILSDFGSAKM